MDCDRVRSDPHLRACEVVRRPDDVLNVAGRPNAARLGSDAIRFSTQPSLGGRAFIVEAVNAAGANGRVHIVWLDGHPRTGWTREGSTQFTLAPAAYRRLTLVVDHFLAAYRLPTRAEDGEAIVCTDGPEALTERVRSGKVVTLAGSCPPDEYEAHPNRHVEAAMMGLACPSVMRSAPNETQLRRSCKRWRKMAASDRRFMFGPRR
jgi:hypothetical protein